MYTCTPYIIQGLFPKQHVHTTGIHVNVIYTNWHGRSTDFTLRMICKNGTAKIGNTEGLSDLKRSYSYENLPVQTKMVILSRRPILVAILLYEHFVHLTRIILHPNIEC